MKWFANNCRRHREAISLLACGALPPAEQGEIENHLAACARCREYYQEIQNVAAPLVHWKQKLTQLEPDHAAQLRWAEAVASVRPAEPLPSLAPRTASPGWWRELIWPLRHAWAGIAAVWLVMWAVNWERPEAPQTTRNENYAAMPVILGTMEEQSRMLAELMPPATREPAEPPRRNPPPRSERQRTWATG